MVRSLYQKTRLWWRAQRVKRRAATLDRGEIEVPLLPFIVPRRLSVDVGAHKAVSNAQGTLTFFVPTSTGGEELPNIGSLKANEAYATREYKVEAVRLDDENLKGVGFIKVDVEGTELDVLKGAMTIIDRDRPVLMVEINDKNTPEAQAIESLMTARGYAIVDFSNKTIEIVETVRQVANRNVIFLPRRAS